MTMQLRDRVIRGAGWLHVQKIGTGAVKLGTVAVLARVLTPSEFGLVAAAQVVLRLVTIVGTGGVEEWIVAGHTDEAPHKLSAAFWFNTLLAVVLVAAMIAALPLTEAIYGTPVTADILALLFAQYLLEQIAVVPEALLMRSLEYRRLVLGDIVIALCSSALAIGMVFNGWGLWSLAVPLVAEALIRLMLVSVLTGWIPEFRIGFSHWRDIARFVMHVKGMRLAGTVSNDGDTLIVGRLLGAYQLGLYDMAFQTSTLVKRAFINVVGRVSAPALASVPRDQRITVLARGLRLTTLIAFPILTLLFILSGNLVLVLYGAQWGAAVPPARIFLLFAFVQAVLAPLMPAFNVEGRPDRAARIGIFTLPLFIGAGIAGALWWGIIGAALGVALSRTCTAVLQLQSLATMLNIPMRALLEPLSDVVRFSAGLAAVVLPLQLFLRHVIVSEPIPNLLTCSAAAAIAAIVLLRGPQRRLASDISMLAGQLPGRIERGLTHILRITQNSPTSSTAQ